MHLPPMQVIQFDGFVVASTEFAQTALAAMNQANVSYMLVVENHQLLGILTEREFASAATNGIHLATTPVAQLINQSAKDLDQGASLDPFRPRLDQVVQDHVVTELKATLQTQAQTLQQEMHDRQQLAQELAESKRRYRGILNHLPDLICCFRADGVITFANQAYCQYFNQSLSEILDRCFFALPDQAQHPISLEQLTQLVATQENVIYQHRVYRQDEERWLEWTHIAIWDESGGLIEFQAIGRDMTDRLKAEQKLRENEARNRAMLNAIPDLLLRVRRDGTCLDCIVPNDYENNFYRVQQHIAEVLPETGVQARLEAIERALVTGELQIIEDQVVKDGRVIHEEIRAIACSENEALLMVRDITQPRQSEVQFRRLVENVPGIVIRYVLTSGGNEYITYISRRCQDILGVNPESIIRNSDVLASLVHPDDQFLLRSKIVHSAQTLQPLQVELRGITPLGLKWIRILAYPEAQANGDTLWDGLAIDITENKQTIEALHTSEARFRAVFEQAAIGIIQATLTGQYLRVNQWFCQVLGYTEAELLQLTIQDVSHPEDWQRNQVLLQQLINGELSTFSLEKRYIRKDGQVRWAQVSSSLVQDELDQQQYVLGVVEDIHERKQAEAQLKSQQTFLRQVIDAVSSSIFVKDAMHRFMIANQASAEIYGVTVEEMIGKTDLDFNPDIDQVEEFWETNRQVLKTLQPQVIASQMLKHSCGKTFWYRTTISPFVDAEGELQGVIGVVSDITDLKQTEAALRQAKEAAEAANLAKSQFLTNMSHELRTPLNSILGFSQLLSQDQTLTPTQQDYLKIILRSGEHLLDLINDVLEMSKIDAGKTSLNLESFDLYQLLDNLQKMLEMKAIDKGIQLVFIRASTVPQFIQADASKLRQILLNLLGNAVKFTMAGQVTLRVQIAPMPQQGRSAQQAASLEQTSPPPHLTHSAAILLCCEVEDTGPGIDASEFDSLFIPFMQTEVGKQAQEGTGLGLAISRRFIELMGGNIQVCSTLGQGSTFSFQIPVCPTSPPVLIRPSAQAPILSRMAEQPKFRILVVEDQPTNRQLVMHILRKFKFELREAAHGQDAIEQWENWLPHLILMDMRMPVMDGYEATRQIRQREQQRQSCNGLVSSQPTIIIALTASAFEEERLSILAAGCNDYIPKPFKTEAFLRVITHHLKIHKHQDP